MQNKILEYIVQRLQNFNATKLAFVDYEALSTTIEINDFKSTKLKTTVTKYKAKLHQNHDLKWVDLFAAQSKYTELSTELREGYELGICSSFTQYDSVPINPRKCPHMMFADCDTQDILEVRYDLPNWKLAQTAKGYHAYSGKYVDTLDEMLTIVGKAKCVDAKWIDCSMKQGFAVLRLTGNTKAAPFFVE